MHEQINTEDYCLYLSLISKRYAAVAMSYLGKFILDCSLW